MVAAATAVAAVVVAGVIDRESNCGVEGNARSQPLDHPSPTPGAGFRRRPCPVACFARLIYNRTRRPAPEISMSSTHYYHTQPKPVSTRARCPVCNQAAYSAAGIHPQCAERQADPPRPKDKSKVPALIAATAEGDTAAAPPPSKAQPP